MRLTDTGRPMIGTPLTIDREPELRDREGDDMENVPVRVLEEFTGAADARGIRTKLFAPSSDGSPIMLPVDVAKFHADNGRVEILDAETVDTTTAAPSSTYSADGTVNAPAGGAELEQWIDAATGKPLITWLTQQGVKVPRGTRVDEIRVMAREHAVRLTAQAAAPSGNDTTPEGANGAENRPDSGLVAWLNRDRGADA